MTTRVFKDKILVVDDDPGNIHILVENLKEEYEILFATTGQRALDIAYSRSRPDLILLDIMMPGMDGYEVCSRLKQNDATKDIPVIFLTAKTQEEEEARGLELGAQDYITKPFSLPVVKARIGSVLQLKKELERRQLLKKQLEDLSVQLEKQVEQKVRELEDARQTLQSYEVKYQRLFTRKDFRLEGAKRILVVDDVPENIHILIENLKHEYEVLFANSGERALKIAFSDSPPDLILLDIMMPGMDGYEVCSRLKASTDTWDIPVIFVTALGQEVEETKGMLLGAVDFVTKPFSMPVVEARIKAALRLKDEMDNRVFMARKLEDLNKNLELRVKEKTEELRLAYESLQENEEVLRATLESTIEGVLVVDADGSVSHFNDRFRQIWPIPGGIIETKDFGRIFEALGSLMVDPEVFETLVCEGGQTEVTLVDQISLMNGRVVEVLSTPLMRAGRPNGRVLFFRDISERIHAERQIQVYCRDLEAAKNKIDAILRSVPLGLMVTDMAGAVVLINRTMERLLGRSQAEVAQRPISEVVKDEMFLKHLKVTLEGDIPATAIDIDLFDSGLGEMRSTRVGTSLVRSKQGEKTGAIVVLVDVSRDRELARIKNDFISRAAHELNTPLAAVMGYAELLLSLQKEGELSCEEQLEYLTVIVERSEALSRIVEELLHLSHMEIGQTLQLDCRLFSMPGLIAEVVNQYRVEISGHRFEIDSPEDAFELRADREKLQQVIENLISNAIKYSPGGGSIRIGCRKEAEGSLVYVEDQGIGMSTEQAALAFEKFYRVDTSTTGIGGLGLGMSIARDIVEAHGGRIWIESSLGKGTKVCFTLPKEG